MDEENEEKKKEEQEKYSFIREKVKEKPLNRRKLMTGGFYTIVLAVIFGIVAACVFAFLEPRLQKRMNSEKPGKVTFPEDEENAEGDGENEDVNEDGNGTTSDPVIIREKAELELSDYTELFNKMSNLAADCSRFLVTVTSATDVTDWFYEQTESKSHGAGTLIADNGVEYLVLTEKRLVESANRISVTFVDGETADASVKSYDGTTGLAVLSVEKEQVPKETRNTLLIAELGNSNLVRKGTPIIAAGNPMEYDNAAMFGNITSQSNYAVLPDANYRLLTTDILGSANGTGVLLNLDGKVIGVIAKSAGENLASETATAFAISDIKSLIEKMSNGGEIAYMGIRGHDVTSSIADASGMPKGVYAAVEMDSPAMRAGIQNGDIITEINNTPIENMKAVQNYLLDFSPEQAINLTIMRQGKEEYVAMNFVVTLGRVK